MRARRPLIVASLPIRSPGELGLVGSVEGADLVELRLDYMENPLSIEPEQIAEYRGRVIATIRERSEGGVTAVDPRGKAEYLKKLDDLGVLYDVEASLLQKFDIPYEGKIVSIHYIEIPRVPPREEVVKKISRYVDRAFSVKIALRAVRGYRELLSSLLDMGYDNISVMPLGSDPLERIAYALLGSKLVYGYVYEPTAPGQMHYKSLINIFRCIYQP